MAFKEFLKYLKKKNKSYAITYLVLVILFTIWILLLDSNSWLTQRDLDLEIEKLEYQKERLKTVIEEDQHSINQLENIDSLERFAREYYGHKKENETLFIIETKDESED